MSETAPASEPEVPDPPANPAQPGTQPGIQPGTQPGTEPGTQSAAEPGRARRAKSSQDPLRGSRTSGFWTAVVALVVLLVLLAVFVFQNTQQVEVRYFGWEIEAPLAAALLVATAAGGLVVATAGALRILQLRRRVRRETRRG